MRKHRTWWVALLGAGALAVSGTALPATAEQIPRWQGVEQSGAGYSLDGFTIGYLPEGLTDHGVNATSTTDHEGDRHSEVAWVRGLNETMGSVSVVRSERIQDLEDVRRDQFSHLGTEGLEPLDSQEGFENGAYVSEDTGDLFWLEETGVAVAAHLSPEHWDREQLELMAESVEPEGGVVATATHTGGEEGRTDDGAADDAGPEGSEGSGTEDNESGDEGAEGPDDAGSDGADESDGPEETGDESGEAEDSEDDEPQDAGECPSDQGAGPEDG